MRDIQKYTHTHTKRFYLFAPPPVCSAVRGLRFVSVGKVVDQHLAGVLTRRVLFKKKCKEKEKKGVYLFAPPPVCSAVCRLRFVSVCEVVDQHVAAPHHQHGPPLLRKSLLRVSFSQGNSVSEHKLEKGQCECEECECSESLPRSPLPRQLCP